MRPMTVEPATSDTPSVTATSSQSLPLNVTVTSRRKRQFPWFVGISVLASLLILVATSLWFIILLQDARGPGFSQGRAIKFAHLAGAAYCSEDAVSHWNCGKHCIEGVRSVKICDGNLTTAYVGIWQSKPIVAFRGYRQIETLVKEWRSLKNTTSLDMETCTKCRVNSQVLEEWRSLEECIEDSLDDKDSGDEIRVTGHGFGAAVSAVALLALSSKGLKIDESYNFGMPRTGNKHFSRAIKESFPQRVFRVTHRQDPMVQVPPRSAYNYYHLEPEWFYDNELFYGFKRCSKDSPDRCSEVYTDIDEDLKHIGEHWKYMDLDISTCPSEASKRFFAPLTEKNGWTEQRV